MNTSVFYYSVGANPVPPNAPTSITVSSTPTELLLGTHGWVLTTPRGGVQATVTAIVRNTGAVDLTLTWLEAVVPTPTAAQFQVIPAQTTVIPAGQTAVLTNTANTASWLRLVAVTAAGTTTVTFDLTAASHPGS